MPDIASEMSDEQLAVVIMYTREPSRVYHQAITHIAYSSLLHGPSDADLREVDISRLLQKRTPRVTSATTQFLRGVRAVTNDYRELATVLSQERASVIDARILADTPHEIIEDVILSSPNVLSEHGLRAAFACAGMMAEYADRTPAADIVLRMQHGTRTAPVTADEDDMMLALMRGDLLVGGLGLGDVDRR